MVEKRDTPKFRNLFSRSFQFQHFFGPSRFCLKRIVLQGKEGSHAENLRYAKLSLRKGLQRIVPILINFAKINGLCRPAL